MPVVSAQTAPVFDAGGATITGLASPTRGARDVAAWRVEFVADHPSPVHSLTREETFVVLAGSVTARFADHVETAGPGDVLIVPANVEFSLVAPDGAAEALCIMPVGGQAVTGDGTFTPPWAEWRADDHLAQLAFFVKSPVLLGRAVIPSMRAAGFGRIVAIDSEVADRPPPGRSAYATAKSAQIGLMRRWVRELAPYGITVNAVGPGFIPVERHADVSLDEREAYQATVPVGRMGVPADISNAVSFLVSERSGFVTGQRILVDGGRTLFGWLSIADPADG